MPSSHLKSIRKVVWSSTRVSMEYFEGFHSRQSTVISHSAVKASAVCISKASRSRTQLTTPPLENIQLPLCLCTQICGLMAYRVKREVECSIHLLATSVMGINTEIGGLYGQLPSYERVTTHSYIGANSAPQRNRGYMKRSNPE